MGGSSSPPPPPDPTATAAAQTASNKETAIAQARLNNVNQVNPYGSLTYTAGPEVNGVPQYTATTALSPNGQELFDLNNQTQRNIGQIAVDQSGRIGTLLGQPVDLSPGIVSQKLMDLGNARLQPQLDRDWNARENILMNRGIMPGSEGYREEQDAFNRSRNDAYNELVKNSYGQEVQTLLAQRNQPINEVTALLSGSQVSQPNFIGTPQTSVQPTNVAGITQDAYNNNFNVWKQKQASDNALMGGLFGLGGSVASGLMFSDRRLKENIHKIGKTDKGTPIYSYKYKGQPQTHIGMMAQDIEKKAPEAVTNLFGFKAVDYSKAVKEGV